MENGAQRDRNEGPPRKRLLTDRNPRESFATASPESTVSSESSSDRFTKKTRELPNLSDCHSCGVRINYTNPRERLQPLDSMWRVVLLCKKCTKRVGSSELCPYCFSAVADEQDCFKCRDCRHSIHKDCVVKYGSGLGFSVCVDCWVPDAVVNSIPVRKRKNRRKNKESCGPAAPFLKPEASVPAANQGDHLGEELERKVAAAAKATENAARKAVVAKNAIELARGALGIVAGTKVAGNGETKVVDDTQLAFILHRAINSSPRISRYGCSTSYTPITCYSRRRRKGVCKKTVLMNSSSLDAPLMCYTRRRRKGGLMNSTPSGTPLVCYSRRRAGSKACSKFTECHSSRLDERIAIGLKASGDNAECSLKQNDSQENDSGRCDTDPDCWKFTECHNSKVGERNDRYVSMSSSGLKASGDNAEYSLKQNDSQENDSERCDAKSECDLLTYHRVGKGVPRPSVFVKASDCGSCMDSDNLNTEAMSDTMNFGNIIKIQETGEERCSEIPNRFLLKYKKRSARSKQVFSCRIEDYAPLSPLNSSKEPTTSSGTKL